MKNPPKYVIVDDWSDIIMTCDDHAEAKEWARNWLQDTKDSTNSDNVSLYKLEEVL